MLLDPPFDAPPAPAPALEAAVAQQRRRSVRALRGGFGRNRRAGREDRPRHPCRVVCGAWAQRLAGERGDGGGVRRRDGCDPLAGGRCAAVWRASPSPMRPSGAGRPLRALWCASRSSACTGARGRRQGQAQGLTWPLRLRLLGAASDRLIDDRNRALLAVAYDAMLRRAELPALQVSDLLEGMQGDATLLVRRSKTDGEGRGEMVYLARDTVRLVHTWLERSGITRGRLFRSVHKCDALGERLDPSQVPRIFKEMACRAGLPEALVEGLSGHSAQVGTAQDMIAAGIELPAIVSRSGAASAALLVS